MSLRLYNTLSRRKEEFRPVKKGSAGMYACGITAYDSCHVGHARAAIVFDVLYKYLKYKEYNVTYVKNFTDVDDKIIAKAQREGCDIATISERYIKEHNDDMDALGVARPTIAPKATDNIQGMIRLITILIEKGHAYVVAGDVYYSVESFKEYGKLSGRKLDDMQAGARIDIDEKKRNPFDFALWKSSKEGEPWWDSPWGRGRPGWHIECSVMSQRYLGETLDIHGGGEDLIFPHHENEIAQSEGATGKTFANYWIHNGFIRVNSEKMSKSLGNYFTIRDVLKLYHPEVIRFFILQSHYRTYIDFFDESLVEAKAGIERVYETMKNIRQYLLQGIDFGHVQSRNLIGKERELYEKIQTFPERFTEAMDDDLNTARAIGYIFDTIRTINSYLVAKNLEVSPESLFVIHASQIAIWEAGKVLGLFIEDPEEYFAKDKKREAEKLGIDTEEIERLLEERKEARVARNWQRADEIRDMLAQKHIILKDSSDGTSWKISC